MKLRECNVLKVYVCPQGVYPSMHLGRVCVCGHRGVMTGDEWTDEGVYPPRHIPFPVMVTEAGGTHPTGMHSCL